MFDTTAFLFQLEKVRDFCYQNSKDKGFWDEGEWLVVDEEMPPGQDRAITIKEKPWNFGEKIALIHSELSEMLEAWRKGVKESDKNILVLDPMSPDIDVNGIKTGVRRITAIEEEVADVFIRLMDLCGKLDIDVGRVVLAKMEYNKNRPHMHGGRKC